MDKIKPLKDILNTDISPPLKPKILSVFLNQLSIMTSCGIGIHRALEISLEQSDNKKLNGIINVLILEINQGKSLSYAISMVRLADSYMLSSMIKAGEVSGNLPLSLEAMSKFYMEKSNRNREIKSALIYPAILVLVSFIVVVFMIVRILPSFSKMFLTRDIDLPFSTRLLMSLADFLNNNGLIILAVFLAIFLALSYFYKKSEKFKYKLNKASTKAPFYGKIKRLNTLYTASSAISILSKSGINLVDILEILEEGESNLYVKKLYKTIIEEIKMGEEVSSSFERVNFFPQMFVSMVQVGVESGRLDQSMAKASDYYQKELSYSTKNALAYFEPLMILIMALVVGFIVVSIAMPMFELTSTY